MYKERIDRTYVLQTLKELLAIPSPSGYCREISRLAVRKAEDLGLQAQITPKNAVIVTVPGHTQETLGLTGHMDTLGAMVRSVKSNGMIRFAPIGGYMMGSIEGEYCTIHKRDGGTVSGTVLTAHPSVHVYPDAREFKREEANMEIRLDESVKGKADVEALGIRTGDFISFDSRTQFLDNEWIKSRHLDDKAGVACLFGLLDLMRREGRKPRKTLYVILTGYEEVGHGAAYVPQDIDELLAVDMGAIGDDLNGTEKDVSICAKDSSGPYDYGMVSRLIELAEREKLQYAVDIYPSYGSDASAALRGGNNVRAALIGPGVHASHTLERTHEEALWNTIALLAAYTLE